jgi:hypothetical protein
MRTGLIATSLLLHPAEDAQHLPEDDQDKDDPQGAPG